MNWEIVATTERRILGNMLLVYGLKFIIVEYLRNISILNYIMKLNKSDKLELISDNQWIILISGFIMLLEELLNKSNKASNNPWARDRAKANNRKAKILEADFDWNFTNQKSDLNITEATYLEKEEIKQTLDGFTNLFEKLKLFRTIKIQNTFLML